MLKLSMVAEIGRGLISARTEEALRARRASGLLVGRIERPRQKQAGQAPSENGGAARQRVRPEVHHEALQFFACQTRKLDEEARDQETEAVKPYGRFGTFAPLGPISKILQWIRYLCRISVVTGSISARCTHWVSIVS